MAHSSPLAPGSSTRASSLPSSLRPSELASRRAGSMVSTAAFLPRSAIPAAMAADVVVLPTPPDPAQMTTCLRPIRSSTPEARHSLRSSSAASVLQALDVHLRCEQERQRDHRGVQRTLEPGDLRMLLLRPRVRGQRGGHGLAGGRSALAVHAVELLGLRVRVALGQHRVHHHRGQLHAHLLLQPLLQLDRLVHRHLLGQRHRQHGGRAPVADELVEVARVLGHRPDLGDLGVGARRPQHGDAVAAGRRVHHARVERAVALVAPLHLRQLPDLAERDQLVQTGCRRGQVREDPAGVQQPRQPAGPQLVAQPLLLGVLGVQRERRQPLGHLGLRVARRRLAEQPGDALLLGHLGDDRPPPGARAGQADGGGHGGLAHAALAGHEDQALVQERGRHRC